MQKYLVAAAMLGLLFSEKGSAQGPGGGASGDRQIVAEFDRNGDGRLDADERRNARAVIGTGGGRGFRRFGGRGLANVPAPGKPLTSADVRSFGREPLYATNVLRTVFLQFDNTDWEQELEAFYRTDVEVPATVTIDGKIYRDVGVHFRGQSSFGMVPPGMKRSLNLSFDFVHEDQEVGGYRTLNLLNGNGDPTFVRGVLYSAIAAKYIPSPAANYVRVVINSENWGIYVSAQQFNKDFVRDWFKTTDGARWKVPGSPNGRGGMEYLGDAPEAYKRIYEIKTRDRDQSWRDLIALFRVLNTTAPEQLEAALSPIFDIDGALKFLALEVALVNSDGYWARASDYNIYQDPNGRFHVIPHDVNEGLAEGGGPGRGGFGPRGFGAQLDPLVNVDDPRKPLRAKLLAVPALRARYLSYVRDIAERWLNWAVVEPMVREYQALIADDIRDDTKKLYGFDQFASGVDMGERSLKSFMERRREFLLRDRVEVRVRNDAAQ